LERSADTKEWEEIAFIAGNGTTNELTDYAYLDESPLRDWNYYRLQQIDFDATVTYSNIQAVQFTDKVLIGNVFPNPSSMLKY
jgi:hypothetical protein